MQIPDALAREWRHEADWLAALPTLVAECAVAWRLVPERPVDTPHALVVPAGDTVLKLNAPSHYEADHEADALAAWAGDGAVRLLERDDERRALLVERCRPGTLLGDGEDATRVICDLLPRLALRLDGPHPFRLLADEADRWLEQVPSRHHEAAKPFERSLLELALETFRTAERSERVLVNQDLHGGNVLRAEREPCLVIDPKPLVGEGEASSVGLLRNAAWHGGELLVRRWLDELAPLGLDRERMRAWGVAHALAWGWDRRRGWLPEQVEAARVIAAA